MNKQLEFYTLPFTSTGFGYVNDNKDNFAFIILRKI